MSSTIEPVSVAILNGGRARRLGGADKSKILLAGQSILERQLQVLRQRCTHIAIVGGGAQETGIAVLADRVGGKGPLDGIASALQWSPTPWLLVVASDMPCLSLGVLDALFDARAPGLDIIGTRVGGRAQPLMSLYHRRILPELLERLQADALRASALLESASEGLRVHLFEEAELRLLDPELRSFQNLNTPEDVLTSEALIE